jgi:hypothetical protein
MIKFTGKLSVAFLLVGAIVLGMAELSQGALIAEWNYNLGNSIVSTDNADGVPSQSRVGATLPTESFSSEKYGLSNLLSASDTRGLSWAVSTEGYQGISLSFNISIDNKAPNVWKAYYSADGGSSWSLFRTDTWSNNTADQSANFDLSTFLALSNNSLFQFKYESISGGDGNANRKVSFDNVKFTGTVVPIPAAAWLLGTGLIGLVALRRRGR